MDLKIGTLLYTKRDKAIYVIVWTSEKQKNFVSSRPGKSINFLLFGDFQFIGQDNKLQSASYLDSEFFGIVDK